VVVLEVAFVVVLEVAFVVVLEPALALDMLPLPVAPPGSSPPQAPTPSPIVTKTHQTPRSRPRLILVFTLQGAMRQRRATRQRERTVGGRGA
jgi:hypothetical protein